MENRVNNNTKTLKVIDITYAILLAIFGIIVVWRCRYGYANLDESFYLTFPYRFLQGDKILFEEWYGTQMEAIPLMPILYLYKCINGNLDGIFIFIRYLYSFIKILLSVFVYIRLRRINQIGATLASIGLLIYSGYGLMVLSYNSLSIGGLLIAILLLTSGAKGKKGFLLNIFSGLFFSLATIEIPHLVLLFLLYSIVCIIKRIRGRVYKLNMCESMYSFTNYLGFLLGVIISLIAFVSYVLSKVTFNEILTTLPHIALEDSGHPVRPWYKIIGGFFKRILLRNEVNYISLACYAILFICLLFFFFDKKRESRKELYKILVTVVNLAILFQYAFIDGYINYIIFSVNVFAISLFLIDKTDEDRDVFYSIIVPGVLFSFLDFWASNTGFYAIANASCVASIGSMLIAGRLIRDGISLNKTKIRSAFVGLSGVFVLLFIGCLTYYKINFVFWENGIKQQKVYVDYGTQKGLFVSQNKADYYDSIMRDTAEMRELSAEEYVLYFSDLVLWISGEQRYGTHTSLNSGSPDMLYKYYDEHPDKIPSYVYIENGRLSEKDILELQERLGLKSIDTKEIGVIIH